MSISRCPHAFQERKQLIRTVRPGPRLELSGLLVHGYPTGSTVCKAELAEGAPAPDRAALKEWVPPLE